MRKNFVEVLLKQPGTNQRHSNVNYKKNTKSCQRFEKIMTKAREMHLDYRALLFFIFGILDKLGSADQ